MAGFKFHGGQWRTGDSRQFIPIIAKVNWLPHLNSIGHLAFSWVSFEENHLKIVIKQTFIWCKLLLLEWKSSLLEGNVCYERVVMKLIRNISNLNRATFQSSNHWFIPLGGHFSARPNLLNFVHFKKTFAQSSFLSKVLSFLLKSKQSQQKWQHFWKKWGLCNWLLKMNGL